MLHGRIQIREVGGRGSASIALRRRTKRAPEVVGERVPVVSRCLKGTLNGTRASANPPRPQLRPVARQCAEHRKALRQAVPPWGVLLDHRHNGKLVNLSRKGLAIETRQAPTFGPRAVLKVCWDRGAAVQLEVGVVWCRMIGTEEVGEDLAPRFLVGLECTDSEALVALGAVREVA